MVHAGHSAGHSAGHIAVVADSQTAPVLTELLPVP